MHKLQEAQQAVNAVLVFTVPFNLNNNLMKCGSSIFRLTVFDYFHPHNKLQLAFILVTVEREYVVAFHDIPTDIYASPSE